jgi:hypothetical protein
MNEIKNSPRPKGIYLSIKLGNPKYECARFGICEIDADGDFHVPHFEKMDKKALVHVSITKNKQLNCLFDRSRLTPQTDETHFASGFFTMEAAKALPTKVTEKLGIEACQIEAGIYAISVREDYYKIVMDIKPITDAHSEDCNGDKKLKDQRAIAL